MEALKDIRMTFHRKIPMLVGLCLCLYFSYHTVSGQRSYTRLSALTGVLQEKQNALSSLERKKDDVEVSVLRMRPGSLSSDMLDERVRLVLGYKYRDEIIVLGH
ncbi:MAG: septum formation initiator family protein [Zetaproteobacteria bacterium]|nr:MAG: septum formation initiator family protein [Zetaproteobacteria bacterium]